MILVAMQYVENLRESAQWCGDVGDGRTEGEKWARECGKAPLIILPGFHVRMRPLGPCHAMSDAQHASVSQILDTANIPLLSRVDLLLLS